MKKLVAFLICSTFPVAASAHHSVGAFFDLSTQMEVEGTIKSMRWQNPHVLLTLERVLEDGQIETWEVTSGGPTLLRRLGVTSDLFSLGDQVTALGFPSRVEEYEMIGVGITPTDGPSLPMFPIPTLIKRFGIDMQRGEYISQAAREKSMESAQGIFRVWAYGRTADRPVLNPVFTEDALAGQAEYNPLVDDPALNCEAQGMPIVMDNPFPIGFTNQGDTILLELEVWDIDRTIHLAGNHDAAAYQGTPMGYSVGRWDNDTLVVETTAIDWRYFDDAGTPQGPNIQSVERFTLSEDESRLDYNVTITDPDTLREPVSYSAHWNWVPGEELQPYNCTLP